MEDTFAYYVTALKKDFHTYCGQRLQEIGVSPGLLFFLIYIGKHPDCSPSVLAAALHADTGHTTRSIDKLIRDGFVSRTRNQQDRRAFILALTEKGHRAFQEILALFHAWDKQLLAQTSPADRETLFRIVGALVEARGLGTLNPQGK